MNPMSNGMITLVGAAALAVAGLAYAAGGDDHSHDSSMGGMDHGSGEMFLVKKQIDGYEVSFHVMEAQPGMEHGGSHNFMVKVEQGGTALGDVKINSKVVTPDGDSKSKPLMKMGDWYMNGYDMNQSGQYQLMILFKTADGEKHQGGVFYPEG